MADWFRHDVDAHNDIKIRRLLRDKGLSALGLYWYLVEFLYQNGGSMPDSKIREEVDFIAESEDELEDLKEYGLLSENNGIWTSQRVVSEIAFHEERRKKLRQNGMKGGRPPKTKENQDITKENQLDSKQNQEKPNHNQTKASKSTITETYTSKKDNSSSVFTPEELQKESEADFGSDSDENKDKNKSETDLFGEVIDENEDRTPYKHIAFKWNEICGKYKPKVRFPFTEKRQKEVRDRWKEYGDEIIEAFGKIASSDFLKDWQGCTFDWCFKENNMVKIIEGNYNSKRAGKNARGHVPTDLNGQYDDFKEEVVTEL